MIKWGSGGGVSARKWY